MKNIDILIITGEPFPIGMAATNRIISYTKELAKVRNVRLCTYSRPNEDTNLFGSFDGIEYFYTGKEKKNSNSRIIRAYRLYKRKFLILGFIIKNRPKSIIYVSRDMNLFLLLRFFTWFLNIKIFREINEAPLYIKNEIKRNFISRLYGLFDGMVIMTNFIRNYFSFIPDRKCFILPMSVDISRFDKQNREDKKYFFYCGANLERDGVLDIVKGYIKFCEFNPSYELKLAFPNNNDDYTQKVLSLVENCWCKEKIQLLGAVNNKDIPFLMQCATALLTTPHVDYKTGGFPTKLGEYLASGVPTVVSAIPSLTEYLDENTTFLVKPNSPNEIAKALKDIVENKEKVQIIIANGLNLVKEKFVVKSYIPDLIKFLNV